MEQQPFDKAVKDSLKNMNVAFNADHWQQMESLLNNLPVGDEGAIDAHFDAVIKDKIGAIESPLAMSTWANIEAGLSVAETADAQFDSAITDKIGTLQGGANANWSAIEQALDLEEVVDAEFDAQVYANLQNLQSPYKVSNWQRLVNKLNADYVVKEKLYRYKLMEATLMILLLLQFYQYLPSNDLFPQKTIESQEIFEQPVVPTPTIAPSPTEKITSPKPTQPVAAKVAKKVVVPPTDNANEPTTIGINSDEVVAANTTVPAIFRNYSILQKLSSLGFNIEQRSGLSISVSEMNQHLTLHTETGNSIINTVPSLTPNFVESLYITPLGCKNCKYSKIPARLRLGVYANIAFNNTYVSGGDILDINAFTERGFGYGSGFSVGFKYSRWEIETGLTYAAKRYDPNIVDTPAPNQIRTHFQTVHLQTIQFPVNLRYTYAILGKGKWHLYAQTGAAINLVLRTEYDLAQVSSISRSKVNDVTTSRLNQIAYNKGIFAGDGFKSNSYLSINMGAGAERYISPSWSIFLQPDFNFHFSGSRIGPTQDRINTFAISFGARKSL